MIQLVSKEQWVTQEQTLSALLKTAKDKHKRVVLDLEQLAQIVNTVSPSGTAGILPILHPNDPTSGIFPSTGPIGIQIRIGGITIVTIDSNGLRMGA